MKNKYKILVFAFTLILCVNCTQDLLTTNPTDRISVDYFWSQEKDAVLAVNACYPSLGVFRIFGFEGCSDNATTAKTWTDSYEIANSSFNSSWPWVSQAWADAYKGIGRANDVIENIDKIQNIDESLKNRLKGEALFFRAFLYNILINLYGDVPYVNKPILLIDESKLPRESKDIILSNIIKDLDKAYEYLPQKYDNNNIGRVTKGAAMALKARALLWQNKFKEARDAAKAVIDLGEYRLYSDFSKLFTYATENNEEIILDEQFMPALRMHNSFENLAPRSSQGLSNYVPTRSIVDAYEKNDPRQHSTILFPMEVNPWLDGNFIFNPTPGSGTIDEVAVSYHATITGYHFKKYVLKEDAKFPTRCSINLVHIRYADVLLMFAEAENEINGPTNDAYSSINQIRARARGLNSTTLPDLKDLTKDQLRDAIRNERRVELAGEGLRYFDLLRWKTAEIALVGIVQGMDYTDPITGQQKTVTAEKRTFNKDRNYLWPIPQSELRLNPNLGSQNPGY